MIETVRLVAAGVATVFFLLATFTKVRGSIDNWYDDTVKVSRLTAVGTLAAAVVFGCEVLLHFFPAM